MEGEISYRLPSIKKEETMKVLNQKTVCKRCEFYRLLRFNKILQLAKFTDDVVLSQHNNNTPHSEEPIKVKQVLFFSFYSITH